MTRIGITGHQMLEPASVWGWVEDQIRQSLAQMSLPIVGVSCLAVGSDQLFARLVLERGGQLHAVLPYSNIERSFGPDALACYHELVKSATVEVLITAGTDEDAYLAAGYRVVNTSDVLIAVWNGLPARGKGGTGDAVAYARAKGVPIMHINPSSLQTCRL